MVYDLISILLSIWVLISIGAIFSYIRYGDGDIDSNFIEWLIYTIIIIIIFSVLSI